MKDQENKKTLKTSRQRYFQMLLTLGSLGPKLNLWTEHTTSLIDLLVTSKFVSQELLEKTLYNLRIEDRDRLIYIKNLMDNWSVIHEGCTIGMSTYKLALLQPHDVSRDQFPKSYLRQRI
jgi:hypothetical protein